MKFLATGKNKIGLTSRAFFPRGVVQFFFALASQNAHTKGGGPTLFHTLMSESRRDFPIIRFLPSRGTNNSNKSGGVGMSTNAKMFCACSSAVMNAMIMTPLDVVKTRLQSQRHSIYTGTFDALLKIPRQEGISALWKGLSPGLLMSVPSTMIYFTCYDVLKNRLTSDESNNSTSSSMAFWAPAIAGSIARSAAAAATSPLEYMKTYIQVNSKVEFSQLFATLLSGAAQQQGAKRTWMDTMQAIRRLYTGIGITLLRDAPYAALYWIGYETLKSQAAALVPEVQNNASSMFVVDLGCGFVSGTLASALTNPIDVVKTSIQTKGPNAAQTITAAVREIYAAEGWRGFVRGMVPRVIRVGPNTAVTVSFFELFKHFIKE